MAFTRFHDDPCRINKQLQESTGLGRYMLNVPGNGDKPLFMDDPFIRLQKWGGNLMKNTVNLESDLFGLSRNLNRDERENDYQTHAVRSHSQAQAQAQAVQSQYASAQPFTDQSRATHPAWTFRDLEQTKFSILPLDPQANVCYRFQNNLNTRLIEKDIYVAKAPYINI
jgi:hypothetical protein